MRREMKVYIELIMSFDFPADHVTCRSSTNMRTMKSVYCAGLLEHGVTTRNSDAEYDVPKTLEARWSPPR